ncbi:MAG TPA: endonuclease/exonuclease/phosphatase family protein, partial [Longimicrobiales bacterium]|nr:endonuclease/exonuclease/phosphatase family protein [Longimicrobiales bacterium]
MHKSVSWLALTLLIAAGACTDLSGPAPSGDASFGVGSAEPVTVMSRNLYLGANIDALIGAEPGGFEQAMLDAVGQLTRTTYTMPHRLQYIAMEIATRQPDVIGLQEVTRYTMYFGDGSDDVLDYLQALTGILAQMGQPYDVAAYQPNVSLTLPVGMLGMAAINYTDGDAILVRRGVQWRDAASGHFVNQVTMNVLGNEFRNLRGWNAVTVKLQGHWYRVINAHLEIQPFAPYQEAQAEELIAMAAREPHPLIMLGDFNSAANADAPPGSMTGSYASFLAAGFADLWLNQANMGAGVTCCQAADLSNAVSQLNQRL